MEFSAFGFCSALHAALGTTFSASSGTGSGLVREFLGVLSPGSSPFFSLPLCLQVCRRPLGAVWQGSPSQRWAAGGSPAAGPCSTSTAPRSWRVSAAGGWGSKSQGCRGWGRGMLSTGLARAAACREESGAVRRRLIFFLGQTQPYSPPPRAPSFPLLSQGGKKDCMIFFFLFNLIPVGKALFLHPPALVLPPASPLWIAIPQLSLGRRKRCFSPLPAQMLVSWL